MSQVMPRPGCVGPGVEMERASREPRAGKELEFSF